MFHDQAASFAFAGVVVFLDSHTLFAALLAPAVVCHRRFVPPFFPLVPPAPPCPPSFLLLPLFPLSLGFPPVLPAALGFSGPRAGRRLPLARAWVSWRPGGVTKSNAVLDTLVVTIVLARAP